MWTLATLHTGGVTKWSSGDGIHDVWEPYTLYLVHVSADERFYPSVIVATMGPPLPICRGPDTADVDIADSVLSLPAAAPAGADTGYYSQACILLAQPFLISICAAQQLMCS